MPINNKVITNFIRDLADRPLKTKELAKALLVPDEEYPKFRRLIKQLIQSGELVRLKRGRVGVPDQLGVLVGKISITRKGTGFLIREGEEQDILIPSWELQTALDGDQVMVRLKGESQGRPAGSVIKIIERAERNIVGVLHRESHFATVKPDNPRFHRDLYIPSSEIGEARDGEKVVARLVSWDDPQRNPVGRIVETIGMPNEPGVDMLTVIKSYELPEEFPPDVLDQAEQAAARLAEDTGEGRVDLTHECIYTIDPADAKDHDDAVDVTETDTGFRLGVHIADVSHFVEPGSALDVEAFDRGNSVYLPGIVIPMLPEVLSNDTCSLKPNKKRLAHSCIIDFDKKGTMTGWEIADTIIKSQAKLSYEEVQDLFDGKPVGPKIKRVADNLMLARKLANILSARRSAEGSLDFDLPESKIILGPDGEVLDLGNRVRLESHRLVEEFMLAANRAVALDVFRKAQPFLYRVHDKPDMEKLEAFSDMMKRLGHSFPVSKTMHPRQFARFLEKVHDTPEADFINELMLRSMAKAVYQRENIGHFGLAFKHYTHFTSPIRRYPDLIVHRLVRKLKGGQYPVAFAKRIKSTLDNIGKHCSETERIAERAEREAVKVKQVAFMAKRLGEEYSGVISGVVPYGFFVRLDNLGVEGMVRVSAIDDDFYQHDEINHRLIGRRTHQSFRLGDAIKVGVMRVDQARNEIDLFIAKDPLSAKRKLPVHKPADKTRRPQAAEPAGHKYGRQNKKKRRKPGR
jgi:ribonuclease R